MLKQTPNSEIHESEQCVWPTKKIFTLISFTNFSIFYHEILNLTFLENFEIGAAYSIATYSVDFPYFESFSISINFEAFLKQGVFRKLWFCIF